MSDKDYHFKIEIEFDCKGCSDQQERMQRLQKQLKHISQIIFENNMSNYEARLMEAIPK